LSTKQHILIVEDEVKIAAFLKDYLVQYNYDVSMLHDGDLVLAWLNENRPDLIILDIMLPNKDGLTLCREIRKTKNIPIIFLTAKVEEIDRIIGLEIGADDYVCKPFSPREMVARVAVILRRLKGSSELSDDIKIDEATHKVHLFGQLVELTAVEFQLFRVMFKRPGNIFSRQQLMDSIMMIIA